MFSLLLSGKRASSVGIIRLMKEVQSQGCNRNTDCICVTDRIDNQTPAMVQIILSLDLSRCVSVVASQHCDGALDGFFVTCYLKRTVHDR